ncbi:alpha/beta hydrolase family protein [Sarocladium implicatum]|nr:alpha/beta hydrolase family protein [Sarocladium implicatum]
MSFENERSYGRHILKPLSPPTSADILKGQHEYLRQPSTTSGSWRSTTHYFVGTAHRAEPTSWPLKRFSDDPANIPDGDYDVPYNPATAKAKSPNNKEDVFRLYQLDDPQDNNDTVPCPRIVVKRYLPTTGSEAPQGVSKITLLLLPGMGLPKEIFEPTIDVLLPLLKQQNLHVQEVWAMDLPMCGETALLNPPGFLYGNEKDITRDLLMFITGYMPLDARQDLPHNLEFRRPGPTGAQPVRQNLHIMAHSLGAQAAMLAAAHAPEVFASLTVMDPAMIPGGKIQGIFKKFPRDVFCTGIKAEYKNKEEVLAEVKQNKRTRGWDERVSRVFAEHAVVDGGRGTLRLAAHPRLEWALYYDKETPTHCYDRLKDITTPFNAIMPLKPFAVPPNMFEADVGNMAAQTRITWLPGTTHQIPFEKVDECASLTAAWIKDQVSRSREKPKL